MMKAGESRVDPATASNAAVRQRSTGRRSRIHSMLALVGLSLACIAGVRTAAAAQKDAPYGWNPVNAGDPRYEKYGPRELTNSGQLNQPVGGGAADRIARGLGLDKSKSFTDEQYLLFVTGGGHQPDIDPDCPQLVDKSVRILTNTIGRPLVYSTQDGDGNPVLIATVLASYGLMVDEAGWLESPANVKAPTREVNKCLQPGGYLDQWAALNGAHESIAMLRRSAYEAEVPYGALSQAQGGAAQLVTNQKPSRSAVVGMSIPPALWNVNFCLIYTLNPKLAANMPARWAPIPAPVAEAIMTATDAGGNLTGQVRFDDYRSYFPGSWYPVP